MGVRPAEVDPVYGTDVPFQIQDRPIGVERLCQAFLDTFRSAGPKQRDQAGELGHFLPAVFQHRPQLAGLLVAHARLLPLVLLDGLVVGDERQRGVDREQ